MAKSPVARRTILRGAAGLALAWMTPVKSFAQEPRRRGRRPATCW